MNAKRFLSVGHDCAAVSCYNDEENRAAVSLGRREADNQTKKARRRKQTKFYKERICV